MSHLKSIEEQIRQQNPSLNMGGRLSELINYRKQVQERLQTIIGENSTKFLKGSHRESLSIGSNLS
jgi:hypothetical protein